MTQQHPQSDKLESFRKEIAYLRSLGLLPQKITALAVKAARKKLKAMSDKEIEEAKKAEDERIQAAEDYWDKVDDDEIWDEI